MFVICTSPWLTTWLNTKTRIWALSWDYLAFGASSLLITPHPHQPFASEPFSSPVTKSRKCLAFWIRTSHLLTKLMTLDKEQHILPANHSVIKCGLERTSSIINFLSWRTVQNGKANFTGCSLLNSKTESWTLNLARYRCMITAHMDSWARAWTSSKNLSRPLRVNDRNRQAYEIKTIAIEEPDAEPPYD